METSGYYNCQFLDIFCVNHLSSPINTQNKFRLNLAENLVQPLLDLYARPTCPAYLHATKGRRPVSASKRLIGKYFMYKSKQMGRLPCVQNGKAQVANKRTLKLKIFVLCGTVLCQDKCLKTIILVQATIHTCKLPSLNVFFLFYIQVISIHQL